MKSKLLLLLGIVALLIPARLFSQQSGENLANSILAARKKDLAALQQYTWNSRLELMKNGNMEDIKIEQVNYGPDGSLQRTVLNDEKSQLPGFFLRKRIEENQRKQAEHYMDGLGQLLQDYTLKTPGKLLEFVVSGQVQAGTSPEGKPIVIITGNGVVVPTDTMTLTVDAQTMKTRRVQITTFYDGHQANINATFQTTRSGLTHLQFADIQVPDLNSSLEVHNYDYVPND